MGTPSILSGIATNMRHLSERQRTISENIANSETPGYKAREVTGPDFSALLASQGVADGRPHVATPTVTLSQRMTSLGAVQTAGGHIVRDKDISETKPDGNNVTLEDQLLKMGEVQADFATMTNLYRKQLSLLKTALGRGG